MSDGTARIALGPGDTVAFNLLESVTDLTSNGFPTAAARLLGETPSATRTAIGFILPVAVGGITRQGVTTEGAADVMEQLAAAPELDDLPDASTVLSGGSRTTELVQQGAALAPRWFGERVPLITGCTGSLSGVKQESASTLFDLAIPLALACLKEHVATSVVDVDGLQQTLETQFASVRSKTDPRLATAAGLRRPTAAAHPMTSRSVPTIPPIRVGRGQSETGRFITLAAVVVAAMFLFALLRGHPGAQRSNTAPVQPLVAGVASAVSAGEVAASAEPLPLTVHFDAASAAIPADDEQSVTDLAAALTRDGSSIDIIAYTDPTGSRTGSRPANVELARRRARAVHDALVVGGVAPTRIHVKPPARSSTGPSAEIGRVDVTRAE